VPDNWLKLITDEKEDEKVEVVENLKEESQDEETKLESEPVNQRKPN